MLQRCSYYLSHTIHITSLVIWSKRVDEKEKDRPKIISAAHVKTNNNQKNSYIKNTA